MCSSPLQLVLPTTTITGKYSSVVPCGKCDSCVSDHQNGWMQRMSEEYISSGYKACYCTLTYDEDKVPFYKEFLDEATGEVQYGDDYAKPYRDRTGKIRVPRREFLTVCKKDVQDWIKRFRSNYKLKFGFYPDFRYHICSEYGNRSLRPHYHCLIFGLYRDDFSLALVDWSTKFGFINCSDVVYDKSKGKSPGKLTWYVSKYINKGDFESPRVTEGKVDKPFYLMSKGIGSSYIDRMLDYHLAKEYQVGNFKFRSLFCDPDSDGYSSYSSRHLFRGSKVAKLDIQRYNRLSRPFSINNIYKPMFEYSNEYLKVVFNRCRYVFPEMVADSGYQRFSYKLCRYYYDKIFNKSVSSDLKFALSRFKELEYFDDFDNQLRKLESSRQVGGSFQAYLILFRRSAQAAKVRSLRSRERLQRFYNSSLT